ncbi:TVP38/TMEM64 family protein [Nocardia otitidiscaviarum]|uniref:TVP38/TMEM64 family membrane protein n=1 Tax=Nocardia otitidiscaviarum TaxID=1823 RepID=A0A516NLF7_9NOCA|nr:TVP38/TMEM64 family protein [Nocardia otitidiscaviarum]MBF6182157.1 TVP38/TMEM64 family protein [Nocardia otitidiscaviarum]MCP9624778.1 TVP38/TMEM64 family protein [Nocardia otitidiscaviarum]QDP79751.1 TVP38/TMEM64 family protein [Nocardia otitidiscaviarum]
MVTFLVAVVALFAVVALIPLPTAAQIRTWADSCGPLLPLVFFVAHALICVAPFPRTLFTVSAGMLFGPVLGLGLALSATTVSAVLALLLVRALDKERLRARLTHPTVRAVDARLARRGWLAVGSLRLIAFAPFSVVNYCAALSSVRLTPYVVASFVGIVPGTVGTVLLADALTEHTHPAQLIVSGVCIAVGIIGLAVDTLLATPEERPEPVAATTPR